MGLYDQYKSGSGTYKNIISFAEHGIKEPLVAVQADDPRLDKEVVYSNTEPLDINVIWIDNSDVNNLKVNINNGTNWIDVSGAGNITGNGGGGVVVSSTDLLDLTDTPASYFGSSGKLLRVNSSQDGIEFSTLKFTEVLGVPKSYTGNAGKVLTVNTGESGLEFKAVDSGLSNLNNFTTNDLLDSVDKRYITDNEKIKLGQLDGIVSDQQTINTSLNEINFKMPSTASSNNKVITTSEVNNLINELRFIDLKDTPGVLIPNSYLTINSTGTSIEFTNSPEFFLKKVTDMDLNEYSSINDFTFHKMKSSVNHSGSLELTPYLRSTDIEDLPDSFLHGGVLIANADTLKYEHKRIEDLTFSKENQIYEVLDSNWFLNVTSGKYEYDLIHQLDSKNIIAAFYDVNNLSTNLSYKILNATSIKLFSNTAVFIKVVLNSALGASSPDYGKLPPVYTFLDDTLSRADKTYSSLKIEQRFTEYAKKNLVYTKIETDNKYALKTNEHNHTNLSVLSLFSTDINNNLTWKNQKILNKVDPFFHEITWSDEVKENLEMVINVFDIYSLQGYTTIVNSELLIKNTKASIDPIIDESNRLQLIVTDDGIEIINTMISPQETQKYILGMSPNIKIYIRGNFEGKFYIGAF